MNRMPMLKARDVMRVLKNLGFVIVRQKGSHVCFRSADGRFTLVPKHGGEDIGRGLLHQILREADVSQDEFLENL